MDTCGEPGPSVSIGSITGKTVVISITAGKFSLQDLTVSCDDKVLTTRQAAASNSISLSEANPTCTLTAVATDSGYYTGSASPVVYKK